MLKSDVIVISLNTEEITFLQRIIDTQPTLFDGIVVKDGNISVSEIPQLAVIIFNAYKDNFMKTDINVNIINVVEFTLTILIQTLTITPIEREILLVCLNLCIELLRSNLPAIEAQEQYVINNCRSWSRRVFTMFSNCCRGSNCCSSCAVKK
jgi:hypothetical protein